MPGAPRTVDHEVRVAGAERGDTVFLRCGDDELTFGELDTATERVANGLVERGIKPGEHVALLMGNRTEFVLAWLGASRVGVPVVPVNAGLRGEGLAQVLSHSDAVAVIVEPDLLQSLAEVRGSLANVRTVIGLDDPEGLEPWSRVAAGDIGAPDADTTPSDLMMLMYTSGTTGMPKGVMLRQERIMGGRALLHWAGITSEDRLYSCLPLFHANAAILSLWGAFGLGTSLTLSRRFSASRVWDELRAANATTFNALGTMLSILWKQSIEPHDADNPVRLVLSAACPKQIWEPFERRFGLDIVEFYGTVEGGLTLAAPDAPVGSIGKPVPGTEMQVVRDDGTECDPGEIGELVARPRQGQAVVHYYKNEAASAQKTEGGWLHTGDRATRDTEGFLWYVDRGDHFIRRRGENISSTEVEQVVETHPTVLECAAYGIPSELGEDDVAVAVVTRSNQTIDPAELIDYCTTRMARFQVPRYVRLLPALPKTETHRAKKVQLRQDGVPSGTWDHAVRQFR